MLPASTSMMSLGIKSMGRGTKGQGRAQPEHLWLPLEENPLWNVHSRTRAAQQKVNGYAWQAVHQQCSPWQQVMLPYPLQVRIQGKAPPPPPLLPSA